MTDDIYDAAVREWIARQLRARGHHEYTRHRIRNVSMGIDEGFHGSDVTPPDDPTAAIRCEIQTTSRNVHWVDAEGWQEHYEQVFSVAGLIRDCVALLAELKAGKE